MNRIINGVILVCFIALVSCSTYKFIEGSLLKSWGIKPGEAAVLNTSDSKIYRFLIINNSSEDNDLTVKNADGTLIRQIARHDTVEVKAALNGIRIENSAVKDAIFTLSVFLKRETFKMPEVKKQPL
ncbi:hypothetical protein ACR79M_15695 [Sphingobacterium spiritivorum]|uniref:hypothetical protein n=1 Tax=Sphingobacterium spiritivorum TaxID=258 RepID=UPI001917F176|nr:hypothetical protein [Sphingobacterium spiritivorum]QQT25724.1 hypothetical protein I6J02_18710 [Sphingobacterium spiritivorum]